MTREPFAKCIGRMREHRAATDAVCDALEAMSDGMACFFPCSKDDDLTLEALAASLSDDPHAQEAIADSISQFCYDWNFGEGAGPGGRAATADGLYLTEGGESPLIYFGGAAEGTRHGPGGGRRPGILLRNPARQDGQDGARGRREKAPRLHGRAQPRGDAGHARRGGGALTMAGWIDCIIYAEVSDDGG